MVTPGRASVIAALDFEA
jgi:hypothetical protein